MNWITANIKWIMLVAGSLTCTMIFAVIAPQAALQSSFGESLEGPLAEIIVRNWGALITLVGAMLIYGSFTPPSRPLILIIAASSKLTFIGLVLSFGQQYLSPNLIITLAVDAVMVSLFTGYLLAVRTSEGTHTNTNNFK